MKVEYLSEGGAECPFVRLYAFVPAEAVELLNAFRMLMSGAAVELSLTDQPWVEPVDGCRLFVRVSDADRGVSWDGDRLLWQLRPESWDNVAWIAEPLIGAPSGYQWLEDMGDVRVLLSVDGDW